jgi:(1->4)-alpha-D-glucan 1-alpha-D-glucosylmutase
MAKGVEDTAFYCFNRFVALNEVGGNPGDFGVGVDEFHEFCRRQQTCWPTSQLASSTHDTKRSEEVRARLSLLSEIPKIWGEAVFRWSAMNERHRHDGWPDRNAEYLYYQTLVGAWPLPVKRALAFMQKAAHEAKEYTDAADPNASYDAALRQFIIATLDDSKFLEDLENFVAPLLQPGYVNSLAQTLLKLAAPGVPDIYQGTELWDLSLVDPDNRRPVDFTLRQQLLAKATTLSAEEAWKEWPSGLPKLWLIRRMLKLRERHPDWFGATAGYEAIVARGHARQHVIAFKRGESVIALAPRLVIGLRNDWRDTSIELPPGNWRNELTGELMPPGPAALGDLMRKFPVALLTKEENP